MKALSLCLLWLSLAFPLACTSPDSPAQTAEADVQAVPGSLPLPAAESDAPSLGAAPDFTLPTLAGDSLRLAELRGKVVLVNFWATWCGPCIEEIPELVALYEELEPQGLVIVGVSLDEEGADVVAPFAEAQRMNYPIALDDGTVAETFGGVWALPTTYVIDKEGIITQRIIGLFPVKEQRSVLDEMLDAPETSG